MNPNLSSPARSIFVAGRINSAALVLIDVINEHCNRKGLLLGAQPAPFEQNVDYLWANGRTWRTCVSCRVRLRPPSLVVPCLAKPANIQGRQDAGLSCDQPRLTKCGQRPWDANEFKASALKIHNQIRTLAPLKRRIMTPISDR